MKSLDDLIRHLVEEIALCGDYGAAASDVVKYVTDYYNLNAETNENTSSIRHTTSLVDRRFLEKVWGWLTRHPEIEVGDDGWANHLSLSEVETWGAPAEQQHNKTLDDAPSRPPQREEGLAASSSVESKSKTSRHGSTNASRGPVPDHAQAAVRIYASNERRWHAIAGHAPDPIKIPRLDFACLSIIAAHRERGILQPELANTSGQDRRSVPIRTRRLHEAGYISKVPILVNRGHTSKLTLKRYVKEQVCHEESTEVTSVVQDVLRPGKNSTENPVDFLGLQHKIFDILREVKLITSNELKDRLGITGHPWPMRLVARHLRRLESFGCIKQVKARPDIGLTTPFLFRCVKYIRDPEGTEWLPTRFPSKNRPKDAGAEEIEPCGLSDDEQCYEAQEARYFAVHGGNQDIHHLKEVERQVPQWRGDGALSNLLYDLVHASGQNGISTMDLKHRSMGSFHLRPTENHLSRLVERWQMSQPLHLRYLSIIRDAALTNGTPHYVHYSFENFKKLVDEGKASWESVMTITKEHKAFDTVAALEAQPALDEDGFPKLSSNLFQGRHNNASLTECIRGQGPLPLPRSENDASAVVSKDGIWSVRSGSRSYASKPKGQLKDPSSRPHPEAHLKEVSQVRTKRPRMIKSEPNLLVTHAGRARKVPKKGLPPNFDKMTWAEQKRFLHLQDAAHQYKKMKIVKEIEKQVNDGGDRCETTAAVLNLAIVQYRNAGQETPWDLMEEIRLAALVPSLLALEYSKDPPTMNSAIRGSKGVFEVKAFRPSAVAHSRPLQGFEVGAFEATLASKVHVLGAVPIDGSMKKTNAEVLMQAIPNSVQADGTSTHRVQKAPSGKGAAGARRTAPYIVGDPSDNTVKNSSLPKPPKRKQCRKNKSTAPPQYLPSTAAHTWPDHSYRTATESANQPNSGKRKRSPKNNLIAPPQYRPSTTAHTWPVHSYKIVTQTAEKPNLGKRKHRRKKNSDAPPELTSLSTQPETVEGDADRPAGRYLPSTAAHTWPVTADGLTTERALPLKRKPKSAEPPQNKRQKKVSWKKAQSGQCGGNVYTPTPSPRSSQRLENQTYEQQLGNLFRPTTGCYVGKVVRLDQPGKRGAKRKSRLAVFKSPGIQRLACSLTQTDMTSADTRALEQNPAAHIEVTARHVTTTDAVDIHIPNTAGPPLEVSFPCATAQAVSLPPRESLNGIVKQVQSESFSAQYGAMSQEQNDTAHISSSPKSLDAEQRIGAKRKRSITDEAGREGTRPPTLTATSMVRPSAFGNAPIATGQSEPSEIGQVASTFTDVEAIQPREKAPIPAPTGELIASPSGASPSRHAPVDLGPSENRFSQPRDDNVQSNDDRGSLDLDERTSDEPTRPDNVDEVREQQAPNPCALEPLAFINTSPSTSSNIDSRSLPEDPVSADHGDLNRSHEDAALPTGLAAGNSPVDNEKSLQPRLLDWATDTREESVAGTDSLDQLRQDLPTATSEASQPQAGVENPVEHKMRKGVLKMRPQGGSIAAQRRRIVMDIIDSCGGIYPGVAELGPPFKERWAESGYPGKAETSTLNGVVKYLCDIGKLRRVTSYCQDSRGVRFTKIMITKTDIHTTDPRIFAMRKKVESKHPVWYFPDEVEISDKVRDTYWDREGPLKNRTTKDLEVDEDKVQLQHMPDYIGRYELKEKAREKRKAQKERQAAVMHELIAEGNNSNDDGTPDGSTLGVVDTPQKRRRLLNVAKRSGVTKPQRKVNRLATLNKAPTRIHDFSQAAVQDDASKGLERWHNVRLPYPRNSLTFARMLGVDDFQRDFESQELEEQLHEEAIERIIATDAAEGITYGPFLPPSSSRFETLTLKLSGNGQLISDSKREPPKTVKRSKSLYPDRHSRAARQQMFTVMEPEHIFHPATGTFSINFSACRTPDQIRRRYHWQNQPIKPFHDLIDDTQQWELCEQGLEDAKFGDWTFINYTLPHHHQTTGASPRYWERLWPCKGHRPRDDNEFPGQPPAQETPDQQLLADLAAAESQASPASNHSTRASLSSHTSIAPSPITDIQTPVVPTKRKRGGWNDTPLKTRRLTTVHKPSQHPQHHPPGKLLEEPGLDQRRRSAPRIRRGQKLAADFTQRILTAVTVIRTLTGGVDSNIDWVLVTRVFEPEYDQVYIQGTWPKVLQKHRVQAEMIRVGFQQMFLKAYEKGLVPPLDYDNLEAYNWSWLINWTIEHLDIPIEAAPDLPLQRDEIDQVFDLEVGEDPGMSTYYEFGTGSARIGRREAELHKRAWIQPLVKERQERSIVNGSDLAVVRTWVRANAATKEKVYDSQSAADKLVQVDEKVRDRVTHELLREGVTMNLNKGRPMPGGQYALSQTYLKPLKKRIEAGHLRRAAMFKREVDKSLDDNGEMIIPQISDDALTLVVQNMQAHRRVSFIATNPPMEKFGLGGIGNYRGRQIPKSKYRFDVGLQATDNYREGNPLLPLPKPPRASRSEADKEKIPLWYDIHGDVNWQLWEMAVAAVMSILAMRPSVSIYEVEPPLRPTLGLWEVQMLLDWMVEAGAAQKMGDSYMVAEWWWLCLDSGRTLEEDKKLREDEQRLKLQEKPRTDTEARETAWDETNQGGCWDALGRKDQEDVQMEDV